MRSTRSPSRRTASWWRRAASDTDGQALGRGHGRDCARSRDIRTGVCSVAFSPGRQARWPRAADDKTIKLWDVASGRELRTLRGIRMGSTPSPSRRTARRWPRAAGTRRSSSGTWRAGGTGAPSGAYGLGQLRRLLPGRQDAGLGERRQDDQALGRGQRARAAHAQGHIRVVSCPWRSARTARRWPRAARTRRSSSGTWRRARSCAPSGAIRTVVDSVAFSPGRQDAGLGELGQDDQALGRGDGRELRTLEGHTDWVCSVAFSPDGKTLASGSGDQTIKLWDVATGGTAHPQGHSAGDSVAFSPDGKTLASGGEDTTIKLWDVADGRPTAHAHWTLDSVNFPSCFLAGRRGGWPPAVLTERSECGTYRLATKRFARRLCGRVLSRNHARRLLRFLLSAAEETSQRPRRQPRVPRRGLSRQLLSAGIW